MNRFLSSFGAMLYIPISMFIAIAVVALSVGTFAGIALHGQEIYAWVMQQPALAPLTGAIVVLARLKIDPTGSSSDALFISNGILGMLAVSSAAVSIFVCISMLTRAISMLKRGILSWCQWYRSRST